MTQNFPDQQLKNCSNMSRKLQLKLKIYTKVREDDTDFNFKDHMIEITSAHFAKTQVAVERRMVVSFPRK